LSAVIPRFYYLVGEIGYEEAGDGECIRHRGMHVSSPSVTHGITDGEAGEAVEARVEVQVHYLPKIRPTNDPSPRGWVVHLIATGAGYDRRDPLH